MRMTDSGVVAGGFVPDWTLPEGVSAFVSTRSGGVSLHPYDSNNLGAHVGDDTQHVAENRRRLLSALSGLQHIQWLDQVHGSDVAEASDDGISRTADAQYSSQPGLGCAVLTADCLPVLFCASDSSKVAAAHAGWRGLAGGVLLNTLAEFESADDVLVFLGPAIGPDAFEVGPEVREAFGWASDACFRAGQGDRLQADLYRLAAEQLQAAGVKSISGGGFCTFSDAERFYSYRRASVTGRQVSLIWRSC